MIANLQMYARPETAGALTQLWALLHQHLTTRGVEAPRGMRQDADLMETWLSPNLVLSQTCGMPYRKFLHGKVQLVATPDHGLPGCPPGHYFSAIVVRRSDARRVFADFAGARLAYNDENSQSGVAAPLNHAGAQGIHFGVMVASESHIGSAKMVAEGHADITALDAVTWELIKRYDGFADELRVVDCTLPTTPALPFITAKGQDVTLVREALAAAIDELPNALKDILCLKGIVDIPATQYLAIPNPPSFSSQLD